MPTFASVLNENDTILKTFKNSTLMTIYRLEQVFFENGSTDKMHTISYYFKSVKDAKRHANMVKTIDYENSTLDFMHLYKISDKSRFGLIEYSYMPNFYRFGEFDFSIFQDVNKL